MADDPVPMQSGGYQKARAMREVKNCNRQGEQRQRAKKVGHLSHSSLNMR